MARYGTIRQTEPDDRASPPARVGAGRTGGPVLVVLGALLAGVTVGGGARGEEEELFEDMIVRQKMGEVDNIKIVEDSWKQVVGQREEIRLPVPSSDVLEVQYADASREFSLGLRRVKQHYYTKAIEESFEPTLKKLDKFRKVAGQPWPKQYCLYYLGAAHLRRGEKKKGDAAKARGYFQRLVKEVPDSRFIFEAYMGVGDSYQLDRKYREAAGAFKVAQKRFEKLAGTPKIPFALSRAVRKRSLMAYLRQAQMLDMAKDYDSAVSLFRRVASRSRDYPEIRVLAEVGAVKALVSTGTHDLAITKANELIEKSEREGHTRLLGGAYMALADCYFEKFAAAEKQKRPTNPLDLVSARHDYIRVATLYFEDEQVLPKAMFRAGRCYERLSQAAKEGKRALELAKREYRLVAGQFPDSVWANQAKSRLAALGEKYRSEEEEEKAEREAEEKEKKRTARKTRGVLPMDFEGNDYGRWETTGDAFGSGPDKRPGGKGGVTGYQGKGLVNTYRSGDKPKGTLTSPTFKIERRYITFLIGGGKNARQACIKLLVGGKPVRTTVGKGNNKLEQASWDVGALKGKNARIQIFDNHSGGWGHILVDHIVASDSKAGAAKKGGGRKRKR